MAERAGFEPARPVRVYLLSREALSATQPSLQSRDTHKEVSQPLGQAQIRKKPNTFLKQKNPKESSAKLQSTAVLDEAGLGRGSWKRKPIINIGTSRESRGRGQIRQKWTFEKLSTERPDI